MATLKERFNRWKENRSALQKAGDILFWILIVLFLIPGPRKTIITTLNRAVLHVKAPRIMKEEKQAMLTDLDYNWTLAWSRNEPFFFSDLRDQVIVLNYWASWCPPCVAEMPEFQALYKKYGDRVAFIFVTSDEQEAVEAFIKKNHYNLPVLYLAESPPDPISFTALPTTYIISREGRVVSKKTGAANWDSRATAKILDELIR